jgi:tetratricopeptide (TPR) repeat protein
LGDRIQINRAIEDFNQALKISPDQNDTNIYYKRAFACQRIGRYAEAIIDYTLYIQYNRDHAHKGYLSRGLVYSEIKQNDKALDDITHANREGQSPPKYYVYCMARAQASAGQYDEARTTFRKLADMCRNECNTSVPTFHTYFYYGIAEYELNNYPTALKHFSEALNYNPSRHEQADTTFYIGLTYYASGEMELAEKKFKDVLALDKNHARALFRIGLMQSQNDDLKAEAIKNLTKAHQLSPHESEIVYERGELYRKMGRLDASIHDKRLALQLERTDADPSVLKHYYEVRQGLFS